MRVLDLLPLILREMTMFHIALEARGAFPPALAIACERHEPVPLLQLDHADDGPVGVDGGSPLEELACVCVGTEKDKRGAEVLEIHDVP